jgi:hypothetical protein
MIDLNQKIGEKFKKFELVFPHYGVYDLFTRKAGESILRKGPVLVDEKAVLEFHLDRKEAERLYRHLGEFLSGSYHILPLYLRTPEEDEEEYREGMYDYEREH